MPMVLVAEKGFAIAVGVLLDTSLVRTYLVTSTGPLLRRWIWRLASVARAHGAAHRARAPRARGAGPGNPAPGMLLALPVRERQVLAPVARGLNNPEIAESLGLSPLTCESGLVAPGPHLSHPYVPRYATMHV